jgi:hypothetical protein
MRLGTPGRRLAETVRTAAGVDLPPVDNMLLLQPQQLRQVLEARLAGTVRRVRIAGTLDRRLVCIERADGIWVVGDLSGQPHSERIWPEWTSGHLRIADPVSWLSLASVDTQALRRLSLPAVMLVALYHPEHFPLPRFPLGISDVARAARGTLLGTVDLADMQLGSGLDDVLHRIRTERPDVLGVSATFGQHDLMTRLLDAAYDLRQPPLAVAGGSLTARNESLLLDRFPRLLVARGGGEATIEGLLAYWHGDIDRDQVPGLGFNGAMLGGGLQVGRRRTAKPLTRDATADIFPELDLLPGTFEHH